MTRRYTEADKQRAKELLREHTPCYGEPRSLAQNALHWLLRLPPEGEIPETKAIGWTPRSFAISHLELAVGQRERAARDKSQSTSTRGPEHLRRLLDI